MSNCEPPVTALSVNWLCRYHMDLSGEFIVNAPRETVFKMLCDANSFTRFVDGVSDLKEIDPPIMKRSLRPKSLI
jgi:hypothetical protein